MNWEEIATGLLASKYYPTKKNQAYAKQLIEQGYTKADVVRLSALDEKQVDGMLTAYESYRKEKNT